MEPLHKPVIRLGGKLMGETFSFVDVSVLERISIVWGQESIYDEVPPSVLKIELIVPFGLSYQASSLQDLEVTVEIPALDQIVYRGHVATTKWEESEEWDQTTSQNTQVWRVTVVAYDATAKVRAFIPTPQPRRGNYYEYNRFMQLAGHFPYWGSTKAQPSVSWALYGITDQLVDSGIVGGAWIRDTGLYPVQCRPAEPNEDAWQLMREINAHMPLTEPCYRPDTDSIGFTFPTEVSSQASLTYTGGVLRLSVPAAVRMLDGAILELPDGHVSVSSDQVTNIDSVEYSLLETNAQNITDQGTVFFGFKMALVKISAPVPTARKGRAYSRRIYAMRQVVTNPTTGTNQYSDHNYPTSGNTLDQVLGRAVTLVGKLNGKVATPDVVIDVQRDFDRLPADFRYWNINPAYWAERPIFINNADVLADLSIERHGQVIGGELTFDEGWRHQLRFAPVSTLTTTEITIGQIVTNTTATYDQYEPSITLGDLGQLQQGAS